MTLMYRDEKGANIEEKVEYLIREDALGVPIEGVAVEINAFVNAVSGNPTALELGDPLDALRDVAVIEASLRSNGALIDLEKMVNL